MHSSSTIRWIMIAALIAISCPNSAVTQTQSDYSHEYKRSVVTERNTDPRKKQRIQLPLELLWKLKDLQRDGSNQTPPSRGSTPPVAHPIVYLDSPDSAEIRSDKPHAWISIGVTSTRFPVRVSGYRDTGTAAFDKRLDIGDKNTFEVRQPMPLRDGPEKEYKLSIVAVDADDRTSEPLVITLIRTPASVDPRTVPIVGPEMQGSACGPKQSPPREELRDIQEKLRALDHDPGPIDGLLGRKTCGAIVAFLGSDQFDWQGLWLHLIEPLPPDPEGASKDFAPERIDSSVSVAEIDRQVPTEGSPGPIPVVPEIDREAPTEVSHGDDDMIPKFMIFTIEIEPRSLVAVGIAFAILAALSLSLCLAKWRSAPSSLTTTARYRVLRGGEPDVSVRGGLDLDLAFRVSRGVSRQIVTSQPRVGQQ